jgi:hypothetical protein
MKNIKFMDKEYKDIMEFMKLCHKYDYQVIKHNNIIFTMSLEEFQQELELVLKTQIKEILSPIYNDIKEILEEDN